VRLQGIDTGVVTLEEVRRALIDLSDELKRALNNGLVIRDNWDSTVTTVADSGVAGVEFSFTHGLGRTPEHFQVLTINKAGIVYTSTTSHDATTAYFKCSASNATIEICVF